MPLFIVLVMCAIVLSYPGDMMVKETQIPSTTTEEAMDVAEAGGTGTEVNTSPSIPGDLRVGSLTSKLREDHPKVLIPLENVL